MKKKKLLKQCLKEVIYEYILAIAGWWSIIWQMVDSGGYIFADGEWWCVVVDGGGDSDESSDKDVLENI